MYVEELLIKILDFDRKHRSAGWITNQWQKDFAMNIYASLDQEKSLSTKQAEQILKIISSLRTNIVSKKWMTFEEIDELINSPTYRKPLYESKIIKKEVRFLGDNKLGFRCKFNPTLDEKLRRICDVDKKSIFAKDVPMSYRNLEDKKQETIVGVKSHLDILYRMWVVPVYRFNLHKIWSIIKEERFSIDTRTEEYLQLCSDSINKNSSFKVMHNTIVANVCDDPLLAAWVVNCSNGITV
jgi:hypothetical protein